MKVGFTGTQRGMSAVQKESLAQFLLGAVPAEFQHGDCVGADGEAHAVAALLGVRIVIRPGSDPKRRAFCSGDVVMPPAPFLVRNRAIVDDVDVLVAAPLTDAEQVRSGTWATVRYARKCGKPVVVLPRGES